MSKSLTDSLLNTLEDSQTGIIFGIGGTTEEIIAKILEQLNQ